MRDPETERLLSEVRRAVTAARQGGATVHACVWDAAQAATDEGSTGWPSGTARRVADTACLAIEVLGVRKGPASNEHVFAPFSNPFLKCLQCDGWVAGWHNPEVCGCGTLAVNVPCCCQADIGSACPSWSPVDGCICRPGTHSEPPVAILSEASFEPRGLSQYFPEEFLKKINKGKRG
jgi:hypothetical protein